MKYKVSVIIPVYNVENYLDETINSVLNQDIGFEDNVVLILVNDGSKDNSEEICLKYQKKYPNNVKYIYKDNSGVSDTRNLGYQNAHADYINEKIQRWGMAFIRAMQNSERKRLKIRRSQRLLGPSPSP